jgi:translation initiation factor 2B subunit (eIF-2B alpha/beta/delta family)
MARRAAGVLRAASRDDGKGLAPWQRRMRGIGLRVADAQPAMASLLTLVDEVFRVAARARSGEAGARAVARVLARRRARSTAAPLAAARRVVRLLPRGARVVTLSSSAVARRALVEAHRSHRLRDVVVAESRPGGEGLQTAHALARAGIAVTLVPDALVAARVAGADVALLGADAVTPSAVWNKCGSLAVALAARAGARPLIVATGSDRLVGAALAARLRNVAIAWRRPGALRVRTSAELFDAVPLGLAARIVTERSARDPAAVARALRRTAAAAWWTVPPS